MNSSFLFHVSLVRIWCTLARVHGLSKSVRISEKITISRSSSMKCQQTWSRFCPLANSTSQIGQEFPILIFWGLDTYFSLLVLINSWSDKKWSKMEWTSAMWIATFLVLSLLYVHCVHWVGSSKPMTISVSSSLKCLETCSLDGSLLSDKVIY